MKRWVPIAWASFRDERRGRVARRAVEPEAERDDEHRRGGEADGASEAWTSGDARRRRRKRASAGLTPSFSAAVPARPNWTVAAKTS